MTRNDMIFIIIAIIAYAICAVTLDIPLFMHIIFLILLAIVLIIGLLLKYQQIYENEKIKRISAILSIIFAILFTITAVSESFFNTKLIIDSTIFLILMFATVIIEWFFKKNEN